MYGGGVTYITLQRTMMTFITVADIGRKVR